MVIERNTSQVKKIIAKAKNKKLLVGFVPTMGALHPGHLSLVKEAKKKCGFVVVSIFVNPIQFGPKEDFSSYPRDFRNDEKLLRSEGVDLIFSPDCRNMYKEGFSTFVEEKRLSRFLCGQAGPGHFKGVCTVLVKIFNI
ncbi:MAG: pantoate--beta-alanine ligase, partial [Candidatus Omnitrophica bacterium]|nr:pantoate--beta-alanine ligase [Candidatus Omnitrophota bacterium]